MEWWFWVTLGILVLLAEALTPGGFYLLFIGIAGVAVGALSPFIATLWIQIVLFAAFASFFIAAFRRPLVSRLRKSTPQADAPEFIGETARTTEPIVAEATGNVELRGSNWKARNAGPADLPANAPCIIVSREGLRLVVKPKP
jgi:membrane protein implicated in regulation of membrane protease activity